MFQKGKRLTSVLASVALVITSVVVPGIRSQAAQGLDYNCMRTGIHGTEQNVSWIYYKGNQTEGSSFQADESDLILEGEGGLLDISGSTAKEQYNAQEWYKYTLEDDEETVSKWTDELWSSTAARPLFLSEVFVGGDITSVGTYFFARQSHIEKIWLGKSVSKLGDGCFARMGSTSKDIYIYNPEAIIDETQSEGTFRLLVSSTNIHVASQSLADKIKSLNTKVTVKIDLAVDDTPLRIAIKKGQIEQFQHPEGAGYTVKSWETFSSAMEAGEAALEGIDQAALIEGSEEDKKAAEKVIAENATAIDEARAALVSAQILDDVIHTAEQLNEIDYTSASWAALQDALETAKEKQKTVETTEQVNEAAQALQTVLDALKKASPETAQGELKDVIDEVEKLVESDYTEKTWSALKEALEKAKENTTVTSISAISAAKKDLEKAKSELIVNYPDGWTSDYITGVYTNTANPDVSVLASGKVDSDMVGATKVEIVFDCTDKTSYNEYASIDLSYVIGEEDLWKQFPGRGDYASGTQDWKESLDIPKGIMQEGISYEIRGITYSWTQILDGPVYNVKAVNFYNEEGELLKHIEGSGKAFSIVESAIKAAEEKVASYEGDYTEESLEKMKAAIEELKKLTKKEVESMLPSQVNNLADELEKAIAEASKEIVPADTSETKAKLDETVTKAEALNEGDYTPDSWKKLQDALEAAKKVDDNALNSEIEALNKGVLDAISALKKVDLSTEPPTQSDGPTDSAAPGGDVPAPGVTNPPAPGVTNPPPADPQITTQPVTKPGKPAIKKVTAKKSTVTVTLKKKVAGATSYQVVVSNTKKFKKSKSVTAKASKKLTLSVKYKKLKVKKKGKYFVKVRAVKKANGKNVYGSYSAVKKFTAK